MAGNFPQKPAYKTEESCRSASNWTAVAIRLALGRLEMLAASDAGCSRSVVFEGTQN
jgi:hypothetical protein